MDKDCDVTMVLEPHKELLPVFLLLFKIKFRHRRKLRIMYSTPHLELMRKKQDHIHTLSRDISAKERSDGKEGNDTATL
jgi:hypothetical protein